MIILCITCLILFIPCFHFIFFKRVNPHWNDEVLYQEARQVMSAVVQHITYNEFLPRVIGWNYMNLYNLRVNTEGYTKDYDSTCNPGIFNEFATAAFRFGHSLIRHSLYIKTVRSHP